MQPLEMAYRFGRMESSVKSAHVRLDSQWEVLMLLAHRTRKNGHRAGLWIQVIGMTVTSAASIFGITLPEKFLAFLEMLGRVFH